MVLTGIGLLISLPLHAQETAQAIHPKLEKRFLFDLGVYQPALNTSVRVDGSGGRGTEITLEDDLAFQERPTTPFALMTLRLGERWRIEAEYIPLDRESTSTLSRTITIGDTTYPASTTIDSSFGTDTYRLGFGYAFIKNPSSEMGVSLGVHVTTFDLSINSSAGNLTSSNDTLLPLPAIGLYGSYAFAPNWLVTGRADIFALDYDIYSGSMLDLNLAVEYQITENIGAGLGYRYINIDLGVDETLTVGSVNRDFSGDFNYRYNGPTLYLSLMF
jgi:opacity protein-like surface antigen